MTHYTSCGVLEFDGLIATGSGNGPPNKSFLQEHCAAWHTRSYRGAAPRTVACAFAAFINIAGHVCSVDIRVATRPVPLRTVIRGFSSIDAHLVITLMAGALAPPLEVKTWTLATALRIGMHTERAERNDQHDFRSEDTEQAATRGMGRVHGCSLRNAEVHDPNCADLV